MQYLGIDWGTRRASWCALDEHGALQEGAIPADENGLSRLVLTLGEEVCGCIEMMSGAVWVRDQLALVGWDIRIADARKVKAIAPLACKTDRVDARVLADLARRDLVREVWVPSLEERANRERLRRRAHLIRLRTSATNGQLRAADAVGSAAQPHRAAPARHDRRARQPWRPGGLAPVARDAAGRHR